MNGSPNTARIADSQTNLYGHERELPTLRDNTRVEIISGDLAGEPGVVDGWYYGFGGGVIYTVTIDGWAYPVPALLEQLAVIPSPGSVSVACPEDGYSPDDPKGHSLRDAGWANV